MTNDDVHRSLPQAMQDLCTAAQIRINDALSDLFKRACILMDNGEADRSDVLSALFAMASATTAKAVIVLMETYPQTDPARVWAAGMADLQMRVQADMRDLRAQRETKGSVQ